MFFITIRKSDRNELDVKYARVFNNNYDPETNLKQKSQFNKTIQWNQVK